MESQANCSWIINGVDVSASVVYTTITDVVLPLSGANNAKVQALSSGPVRAGEVGELYFDTTYIDLSTDNPFWDSDANRPKPVRQVLDETSATPLIAMPISADNPGLNLGTGGNFTVNSGPFVGARGASEYWSRSAVVGAANYLTGNVYCESLVKWKSIDSGATWTATYANATTVTDIGNGTDDGVVSYYWGTSENINWALEVNLLRVTDALGYPVDMDNLIADNPNTVLALDFSDTTNFGANKVGTDFVETGTITAGADVIA